MDCIQSRASQTATEKGVICIGGGGNGASDGGADVKGDGVWSISSRAGEGSGGEEGCEAGREPGLEKKRI